MSTTNDPEPFTASGSSVSRDPDLEAYEKAVRDLQAAARTFVSAWIKSPQESSFPEWRQACEKLETAAIAFAAAANTVTPNNDMSGPSDGSAPRTGSVVPPKI